MILRLTHMMCPKVTLFNTLTSIKKPLFRNIIYRDLIDSIYLVYSVILLKDCKKE